MPATTNDQMETRLKGLTAKMENVPGSMKIRPNNTFNLEIEIMIS